MKKVIYTILILVVAYTGFVIGGAMERKGYELKVGIVRTKTTGFYLDEGENIAIGTSTPVMADVHIRRTATSTLALDGVMGCLMLKDKSTGSFVYYISESEELATTTAADCGF